jgi:very-short-patch-repair endonuclease
LALPSSFEGHALPPSFQRRGSGGGSVLTQHFNRRSELSKRKALRNNATDGESRLWHHLRGKQFSTKFRRQYSVDAYVLDFYAPRSKIAIEVDGDSHFFPEAMEYDRERTTYLERFGIEVLRFTNLEIFENLEGVLTSIEQAVARRKATSPEPPPS